MIWKLLEWEAKEKTQSWEGVTRVNREISLDIQIQHTQKYAKSFTPTPNLVFIYFLFRLRHVRVKWLGCCRGQKIGIGSDWYLFCCGAWDRRCSFILNKNVDWLYRNGDQSKHNRKQQKIDPNSTFLTKYFSCKNNRQQLCQQLLDKSRKTTTDTNKFIQWKMKINCYVCELGQIKYIFGEKTSTWVT